MIKLRLQRRGRKRRPFYHIVVADSRAPRDGRVIERLGLFDNVSENKKITYNEDRVIHWLKIGAQPSDTVRNILKKEGILYKMHLIRWGKSEEEIEAALEEWREARNSKGGEKEISRKEKQKELLKSEEDKYKKQAEEEAAAAKKEQELKEAEEEKAKAEAEEAAAEEEATEKVAEEEAPAEEEATEEVAEEEAPAEEEAKEEAPAEEPPAEEEEKEEEAPAEEAAEEKSAVGVSSSTEMNANEAIDHIKNSTLEELEGFVTDAEDRVTVQRAWESKQSESEG